jgi:hypothetical protein
MQQFHCWTEPVHTRVTLPGSPPPSIRPGIGPLGPHVHASHPLAATMHAHILTCVACTLASGRRSLLPSTLLLRGSCGLQQRRRPPTESPLPPILPGSFPPGPCIQRRTRWLPPHRLHPMGNPRPSILQDHPRSDLMSRDALTGCRRADHTSRRTNSHRSLQVHSPGLISAGLTCSRQMPRLSGHGSTASGYGVSRHGSGWQDQLHRTLPTLQPRTSIPVVLRPHHSTINLLRETPAPPLTWTPCLHDHGTHSPVATPSHRPPMILAHTVSNTSSSNTRVPLLPHQRQAITRATIIPTCLTCSSRT